MNSDQAIKTPNGRVHTFDGDYDDVDAWGAELRKRAHAAEKARAVRAAKKAADGQE